MAKIGNINVKVIKTHENDIIGVRVELTRKTKIDGNIIYAIVVTNMNTGYHYRIYSYDGMGAALAQYKAAIA